MVLNLTVHNFDKDGKIFKKYICKNQGGNSNSPKISWNCDDSEVKSYALVLEDPDAVIGNFVHWYIPFIKNTVWEIDTLCYDNLEGIYKNYTNFKILNGLNLIMGKNSIGEFGYHGPCAPDGTGKHRYIFNFYALDEILNIDNNNIQISGSSEFCDILKKSEIKIIAGKKIEFMYSYKNYS
jgi:Raf kinase inhibitor-like YbhB/YbcL family protein